MKIIREVKETRKLMKKFTKRLISLQDKLMTSSRKILVQEI